MPLKTWQSQADFDAAYDLSGELDGHPNTRPEVRLGYCRSALLKLAGIVAGVLVDRLGLTSSSRLIIVGAGYGWTAEALAALGITNVVGLDTSTYIQSTKGQTETADISARIAAAGLDPLTGRGAELLARHSDGGTKARKPILNEDISTGASRSRVLSALGAAPDWGVTEFVVESLTDAEVTQLSSRAHAFAPTVTVAHLVNTSTVGLKASDGWNAKTLEQWAALVPGDRWIEAGTYRVLGA